MASLREVLSLFLMRKQKTFLLIFQTYFGLVEEKIEQLILGFGWMRPRGHIKTGTLVNLLMTCIGYHTRMVDGELGLEKKKRNLFVNMTTLTNNYISITCCILIKI